jgi:hypothetical protein
MRLLAKIKFGSPGGPYFVQPEFAPLNAVLQGIIDLFNNRKDVIIMA